MNALGIIVIFVLNDGSSIIEIRPIQVQGIIPTAGKIFVNGHFFASYPSSIAARICCAARMWSMSNLAWRSKV